MSTSEEHAKDVPAETSDEMETPSESQAKKSAPYIILFFFVGLIASLIVGWIIFPKLLYSQKQQPIDYDHALHTEQGLSCEDCHYFRDDGTFSGIPKLDACIDCHEEVNGEDPEEEKFVTEYVWEEREVPWLVYSKQPDCVFFSHAAHVLKAGNDCETCHGHIGESNHSRPYEYNRITGYSRDIWGKSIAGFTRDPQRRMKMDVCAHCHANARAEAVKKNPRAPLGRLIDNVIDVAFPGTTVRTEGTSVQTDRGACFECHH